MQRTFKEISVRCAGYLCKRSLMAYSVQNSTPQEHTNVINNRLITSVFTSPKRLLYDEQVASCWNCSKATKRKDIFFCEECGKLQDVNPENINYFDILSLDKEFSVNNTELTKKFYRLQNLVHPDKFSNRNEREQENSLKWSSLINKAYKTLSVPIERGIYMLELKGIKIPEGNTVLDRELLIEMMTRNEEVEEADKENILSIQAKLKKDLEEEANKLQMYFTKNDLENAKSTIIKMRYFKSLERSIKEKAVKLGAVK